MLFTFRPRTPRWNAERQAVEFGVEISEYRDVGRVPRRVFQRLLPERPTPGSNQGIKRFGLTSAKHHSQARPVHLPIPAFGAQLPVLRAKEGDAPE